MNNIFRRIFSIIADSFNIPDKKTKIIINNKMEIKRTTYLFNVNILFFLKIKEYTKKTIHNKSKIVIEENTLIKSNGKNKGITLLKVISCKA